MPAHRPTRAVQIGNNAKILCRGLRLYVVVLLLCVLAHSGKLNITCGLNAKEARHHTSHAVHACPPVLGTRFMTQTTALFLRCVVAECKSVVRLVEWCDIVQDVLANHEAHTFNI